jgi:outer membrane receptor protein involved in Fe transport
MHLCARKFNIIKITQKIGLCLFTVFGVKAQEIQLPPVQVISNSILSNGAPLSETTNNAQAIKMKDVLDQEASNLADILDHQLGSVSVSNGVGNPYQNDINYRGFSASSVLGAPIGLSVYMDGIRMNQAFGSVVNWDLIPINALSAINVLPGSNAMFGLNTLGGALVVNTKNGKENPGTSMDVLGGSLHRRAIKAQSGWVDSEHDSDFFWSANLDKDDGYRDHSGSQVTQLFGKTRWFDHANSTQIALSGNYSSSILSGTQSLPMDMLTNNNASYTWPDGGKNQMMLINLKAEHAQDDDHQINANLYFKRVTTDTTNSNAQLDDGCNNADGSLVTGSKYISISNPYGYKCGAQAPNGTALNSITGSAAQALGFARYTSSINTNLTNSQTQENTWGTGVQWTNSEKIWDRANNFYVGTNFDFSRINYDQNALLARLVNYQTVVIPNMEYGFTSNGLSASSSNLPNQFTGSNLLDAVNLSSNTTSLNVFLGDTISANEKLKIAMSGSYNLIEIHQKGANQQFLNSDGGYSWTDAISGVTYYNPSYVNAYKYSNSNPGYSTQNGILSAATAGPQINSLDGDHSYHRLNPSLGFNYQYSPLGQWFANYSESMRAPSSVELSCADPNSPCALPTGFNGDPDLKAIVSHTFEIGARENLDSRTSWNAALYTSRLENDIQFIATSNSYGYFTNVGNTLRKGFEAGISTRLTRLTLAANYGFVDATYASPFTTASGLSVLSGNHIPGIPNQTLKLRAAFQPDAQWRLGANLNLVSSQWMHGNENNADPTGKIPGYAILNLDMHHSLDGNLDAYAVLNNALNKNYSTYGLSGIASVYTLATQNFLTPAAPRSLWIGIKYKFN